MVLLAIWSTVFAQAETTSSHKDSWYIRPSAAVGFNSSQGTFVSLGLDLGLVLTENWRTGLTGHYSSGDEPRRDREYGGGAFFSYAQKIGELFVGHVREEVVYVDLRNPITPANENDPDYENETGIASSTTAGVTMFISDNVSISGGYRLTLGLTNSDLGKGRSGPVIGILIGI